MEQLQEFNTSGRLIKCKEHNENNISCIQLRSKDKIYCCIQCVIDKNINPQNLLSLQTINTIQDETVLINWPPVENENIIQKIKERTTVISQEIENFFDNLLQEVNNQILNIKKNIQKKNEQEKKASYELLQHYNQLAKKDELKKFSEICHNNIELQEKNASEFFNKMEQLSEENTKQLQYLVEEYESKRNKSINQSLNTFQENILTSIQSILNDNTHTLNQRFLLNERPQEIENYFNQQSLQKEQMKQMCLEEANRAFQEDLKIEIHWSDFDKNIAHAFYEIDISTGGGMENDRDWNWGVWKGNGRIYYWFRESMKQKYKNFNTQESKGKNRIYKVHENYYCDDKYQKAKSLFELLCSYIKKIQNML